MPDFNANDVMKYLEKTTIICRDSKAGREIVKVFEGLRIPITDKTIWLAMFCYRLGERSEKNKKKSRS